VENKGSLLHFIPNKVKYLPYWIFYKQLEYATQIFIFSFALILYTTRWKIAFFIYSFFYCEWFVYRLF